MLFTSVRSGRSWRDALHQLGSLDVTKAYLFLDQELSTKTLLEFTRYAVDAVDHSWTYLPVDYHEYELGVDRDHIMRLELNSMAFLRLFEWRRANVRFALTNGWVHLLWADFTQYQDVEATLLTPLRTTKITVPQNVVLKSLAAYHRAHTSNTRKDNFVNMMVFMSDRQYLHGRYMGFNCPFVHVYAQFKTTREKLVLLPDNTTDPITIECADSIGDASPNVSIPIKVVEVDGQVIDSTCLMLSIPRSDENRLLLTITEQDSPYNYSVATIFADKPTDYVNFSTSKFVDIGKEFKYEIPTISTLYKFKNPYNSLLVMIRVSLGAVNVMNKSLFNDVNITGMFPMFEEDNVTENASVTDNASVTFPIPDPEIGDGIRTNILNLVFKLVHDDCYHFQDSSWHKDEACKNEFVHEEGIIKCQCYVEGPYSAKKTSEHRYLKPFVPKKIEYFGPTLFPGALVLYAILLGGYYMYWCHFKDVREQHCAQIHVIRDFYNPYSSNQYLVCIKTGLWPGSGTEGRVGVMLVGETGCLQMAMPQGAYCHS
ncbi:hypothetical protein EGW08_004631, partial [Elysia chlorotica]